MNQKRSPIALRQPTKGHSSTNTYVELTLISPCITGTQSQQDQADGLLIGESLKMVTLDGSGRCVV